MGDYAKALGGKLRAIRQQQGLSLHGVEQKSGGRWKAVVVGSYERGDRAVTVQKLAELLWLGSLTSLLLSGGRAHPASAPLCVQAWLLDGASRCSRSSASASRTTCAVAVR